MERHVPDGSTGPNALSMSWTFVWPPVAYPCSNLADRSGQPPVPRFGLDIFGHRRNPWIDGPNHAWDRFGFRMYAAWARCYAMVVLEQIPVRHRFAEVTTGLVISMFRPGRNHYVTC